VELNWQALTLAPFLRRLAGLSRLIVLDRRGIGCSERFSPDDVRPLETLMDDVAAVMEQAGTERAVVFGSYDSGVVASFFAATYPERTIGLILYNAWAPYLASEEFPWTWGETELEAECGSIHSGLGRGAYAKQTLGEIAPSLAGDPREVEWFIRYMLLSFGPGAAVAELRRWAEVDVRRSFHS
jgi:pimeloyl-ACP methyl ester carboxylesterase